MRTAVIRVDIDRHGALSTSDYEAGIERLRGLGLELIAPPAQHLPGRMREIELIINDQDLPGKAEDLVDLCTQTFGVAAEAGVITFISRGTDDDARGILAGFGIEGDVRRHGDRDAESVTVTIQASDLRRVPESRLHTALEAALNCEVEIVSV